MNNQEISLLHEMYALFFTLEEKENKTEKETQIMDLLSNSIDTLYNIISE